MKNDRNGDILCFIFQRKYAALTRETTGFKASPKPKYKTHVN